eukprot:m.419903 g.419903  ORF g.419903 m.419903 type:complete len:144 (-) comp56629_c0_seq20:251-682(-)
MTMRMQEGLLPQSDWMLAIEDDDAGHLAQRRDQAGNTLLHLVLNAAMDEIPELFNDEPHEAAADIEAVKSAEDPRRHKGGYWSEREYMVALLCHSGATVDARNKARQTAVDVARKRQFVRMEALLQYYLALSQKAAGGGMAQG